MLTSVHPLPRPVLRCPRTQMTAGTSQLAAEMETYIRQTQDTAGQQVTVLKQGYLLKQTSDFRRAWKRRFFVLDSQASAPLVLPLSASAYWRQHALALLLLLLSSH